MQNKVLLLPQTQIQKSSFTVSGILVNNYTGFGGKSADLVDTTMEPVSVNLFGQQIHIIRFGSTSYSSGVEVYLLFQEDIFTPFNTFFRITFSGNHSGEYIGVFNQTDGFHTSDNWFFAIDGYPEKGDFIQAAVECWQAKGLPEATLSVLAKPSDIINAYPNIMGYFPDERGIIRINDQAFNETYLYRTCMNGVFQIVNELYTHVSVSEYSGLEKIGNSYLITSSNPSIVFAQNL